MWRSFFLAVGVFCCAFGAELLVTERIHLNGPPTKTGRSAWNSARTDSRVYEPPEWLPWSLLSTGSIIILYGLTLPKMNGVAPAPA